MASKKYDGVVEAVRYKPNGEVDWVRAYERRGPTFGDHVLIDRQSLIRRLKSGKRYVAGQRLPYLASTFEISSSLRLVNAGGKEILVTDEVQASQDRLVGVPLI